MARVPSKRHTCHDDLCDVHRYPRKRGMHGRGELSIPEPGNVQALVVRRWDDDGARLAYLIEYDGKTWTDQQPLPRRPRKAYVAAVRRAREHVRTGAMS